VSARSRGAELPRIYIPGTAQRRGLGRLLLDAAIRQAAVEGLSHLWLDVMASADGARRASSSGFPRVGGTEFRKPVKAGVSDMLIIAKEVGAI